MPAQAETPKSSSQNPGDSGPRELRSLAQELRPVLSAQDENQFHRGLAAYISELTGATVLIFRDESGGVTVTATRIRNQLPAGLLESSDFKAGLRTALKAGQRVVRRLAAANVSVWIVPLEAQPDTGFALVLAGTDSEADAEARLLHLLAVPQSIVHQRLLRDESERLRAGLDQATYFLETIQKSASAPSYQRGIQTLAEDLRLFIGADQIAIGLGGRLNCKAEALAPSAKFDVRSQVGVLLSKLLRETVAVGNLLGWPQEALPAALRIEPASDQEELLNLLKGRVVVTHPLKSSEGECIGAWASVWENPPPPDKLKLSEALTPHLGATARLIRLARPKGVMGFYQKHVLESKPLRKVLLPALIGIFCLAMLVPIPYNLAVPCWIDPEARRQIAAPFDGVLARAFVKPGDRVEKDQIVAELDGKEIAWKLADVAARINGLAKRRDQALAAMNMAEAQIAVLEIEALQAERDLVQYQSENLQIRAPMEGIILSGDLDQSEGVPVQRGQRLFDISPVETFVVRLAIPAAEVHHINPGMPVSIRLEAEASFRRSGTLSKIEPASRIHESKNVFIGVTQVDDPDGQLRPGMRGRARITAAPKSLGWILFHGPIDFLRLHMPW